MPTIFQTGLTLSNLEASVMADEFATISDAEQWLENVIRQRSINRGDELLKQWLPTLLSDGTLSSAWLAANPNPTIAEILPLIFAHPDYKTRAERDAQQSP